MLALRFLVDSDFGKTETFSSCFSDKISIFDSMIFWSPLLLLSLSRRGVCSGLDKDKVASMIFAATS